MVNFVGRRGTRKEFYPSSSIRVIGVGKKRGYPCDVHDLCQTETLCSGKQPAIMSVSGKTEMILLWRFAKCEAEEPILWVSKCNHS
jgi:hypothetical protein